MPKKFPLIKTAHPHKHSGGWREKAEQREVFHLVSSLIIRPPSPTAKAGAYRQACLFWSKVHILYIYTHTSLEVIIWTLFHFVKLKKKGGGQQQVNNPLLVVTRRQELLFGLFISSATRGIFYAKLGSKNVQPFICHNWLHAPGCFLVPSLQLRFFQETLSLFHKAGEKTRFVQQFFLSPCAPFSFLNVSRGSGGENTTTPKSCNYSCLSVILNMFISMHDLQKKTYNLIFSSLHQGIFAPPLFLNPPFPQSSDFTATLPACASETGQ